MTEMKCGVNKAYDPENLSVRAFRIDSSPSDSGSTGDSSSPESDRHQVMSEIRSDWGAFTERIMGVQIQSNSLNLPRM